MIRLNSDKVFLQITKPTKDCSQFLLFITSQIIAKNTVLIHLALSLLSLKPVDIEGDLPEQKNLTQFYLIL